MTFAVMNAAQRALEELLSSTFSTEQLRRFVRRGPDGAAIAINLPGEPASHAAVVDAVVEELARRGRLDHALFHRLIEEVPGRELHIRAVERKFFPGSNAEAAPPTPSSEQQAVIAMVADTHLGTGRSLDGSVIRARLKGLPAPGVTEALRSCVPTWLSRSGPAAPHERYELTLDGALCSPDSEKCVQVINAALTVIEELLVVPGRPAYSWAMLCRREERLGRVDVRLARTVLGIADLAGRDRSATWENFEFDLPADKEMVAGCLDAYALAQLRRRPLAVASGARSVDYPLPSTIAQEPDPHMHVAALLDELYPGPALHVFLAEQVGHLVTRHLPTPLPTDRPFPLTAVDALCAAGLVDAGLFDHLRRLNPRARVQIERVEVDLVQWDAFPLGPRTRRWAENSMTTTAPKISAVLAAAAPVSGVPEPAAAAPSTRGRRFAVAFSFAGERRAIVDEAARLLARRFTEDRVLYDKFHEAEFARADLSTYLPSLYHEESDLVVVVVCPMYDEKEWTGLEWRAIHHLLQQRRHGEVMLCRFERAQLTGLYGGEGWVELDDRGPDELVRLILERLALNDGLPKGTYTASAPGPRPLSPEQLFPTDVMVTPWDHKFSRRLEATLQGVSWWQQARVASEDLIRTQHDLERGAGQPNGRRIVLFLRVDANRDPSACLDFVRAARQAGRSFQYKPVIVLSGEVRSFLSQLRTAEQAALERYWHIPGDSIDAEEARRLAERCAHEWSVRPKSDPGLL